MWKTVHKYLCHEKLFLTFKTRRPASQDISKKSKISRVKKQIIWDIRVKKLIIPNIHFFPIAVSKDAKDDKLDVYIHKTKGEVSDKKN